MIQTQTVDITYVQYVLDRCPNFDYIVNYNFEEGDTLTRKLIDWYKELIFSINKNDVNQLAIITILDKSLYMYLKDHRYSNGLRKVLNEDEVNLRSQDLIKQVIVKIIRFTNTYDKQIVLDVRNSVWL